MPFTTPPSKPMTSTSQETVITQNQPNPQKEDEKVAADQKKKHEEWRGRIDACRHYRWRLIREWTLNIDARRGKPVASESDENRISVNLDWSLTKTKQAFLFSQVPKVRVNHPPQTLSAGPWVQTFEQKLNDTLILAGIEPSMDEVLPDVINASGIGSVIVSYEAIMVDKEVPSVDLSTLPPQIGAQVLSTGKLPDGSPVPMEIVPTPVDRRYLVSRISPSDLLWPIDFTGSDFDNAPWIGRSGRISWAQAVQKFKLTERDKESVTGDDKQYSERLTRDIYKDRPASAGDEMVGFDEVFYKEFEYDAAAQSYSTIHHMIFLTGKPTPVVDEPWKGQRIENDQLVGATKFPVRILTLAYISDETIPPSDTAIGRPQVNELIKARNQLIMQRDRNIPIRWFDVNRVDPAIQHTLMRGTWSAMIPVQGQGTNILGEVAKSNIPQENFTFDQIAKADLAESWSIGPNQMGSGYDIETKGEGDTVEANFRTRLGRERARVGKFFTSIGEVLGGLLCLYEDPTSFGEGFDPQVSKALSYSILADSTVLLDSNQRLERLINFVNFSAKSGWVNLEPVLKEIATLSGLDPNTTIVPPQPKPPVEPNISLRLTGTEDLTNPLTLAFLLKSGQAPEPELIEKAKQLIAMVVVPAPPPPAPVMKTKADGSTEPVKMDQPEEEGPKLKGMQITLAPMPPQAPPQGPRVGGPQVPQPAPPEVGKANPRWAMMDRLNKRSEEGQG